LAKLIPAEALGAYGAATGLLPTTIDHTLRLVLLIVIAVLCIGILIAVRVKSTSLGTGSPQVVGIIISAISFVIWISTLGPNSPIPDGRRIGGVHTHHRRAALGDRRSGSSIAATPARAEGLHPSTIDRTRSRSAGLSTSTAAKPCRALTAAALTPARRPIRATISSRVIRPSR
jgi:hypothetical protein